MKVECIISHRQPLKGGGFKDFEAGVFYEVEAPDPIFFKQEVKPIEPIEEPKKKKGG